MGNTKFFLYFKNQTSKTNFVTSYGRLLKNKIGFIKIDKARS